MTPAVFFVYKNRIDFFPLLRYESNLFPLLSKRREDNPS